MTSVPSAIIFVNMDLTSQVQSVLIRQLGIQESMTGTEFDERVASDPNYTNIIHNSSLRILVIRTFSDFTNRNLADVAIFVKSGLASIEINKFGPHGLTMRVDTLNVNKLLVNYPPVFTFKPNPDIQNNILNPLVPPQKFPTLFPLGTDSNENQDTIFANQIDTNGTIID